MTNDKMEIKLPEIGDGIESGDVLAVMVKEGETVKQEQGLIELETDKASMEIPSTHAGKVTKIHVAEGDTLPVGGVIVTLEAVDGEATPAAAEEPPTAQAEPAPQPLEQKSEPKEPVAESKPDTATNGSAAPAAPQQAPPAAKPQPTPQRAAPAPEPAARATRTSGQVVPAGPAMRRFAREVGVDIATVEGTGEGGRITRADVLRVVREGTSAAAPSATATMPSPRATNEPAAVEAPAASPGEASRDNWGTVRIEKMPKIRQTIANKMHESWTSIPRVTNFDDADVTELEQIRKSSKADYASAGIKLTSLPFVIKACAMALKENPVINASIDLEKGEVIYKDYVNIGLAVDTDRGLIVPSLRNADRQGIPDIAKSLATIAENARSGNFTVDDLRGSTFTISNLGAIGGTYSTPIINPPEVAILLLGRSRKMPVVEGHKFAVRLMMPLSLSYDHRLVDGGAAARFLNSVKDLLQSPSRLLLAP